MNKYQLEYTSDETKTPLLAQAVLETNTLVNILQADVEYSKGRMIISILGDEKKQKEIVAYLRKNGIEVQKLKSKIEKTKKKCVDCCACYGVCPTNAITIVNNKMVLDADECIKCRSCIEACPTRALRLD